MGVFQVYQDPGVDNGKGEVMIKSINPLDVYIDPNSKDPYARDASNIIVCKHMTDEVASNIYPSFMDIIENSSPAVMDDDDYPATDLAATEGQMFYSDDQSKTYKT